MGWKPRCQPAQGSSGTALLPVHTGAHHQVPSCGHLRAGTELRFGSLGLELPRKPHTFPLVKRLPPRCPSPRRPWWEAGPRETLRQSRFGGRRRTGLPWGVQWGHRKAGGFLEGVRGQCRLAGCILVGSLLLPPADQDLARSLENQGTEPHFEALQLLGLWVPSELCLSSICISFLASLVSGSCPVHPQQRLHALRLVLGPRSLMGPQELADLLIARGLLGGGVTASGFCAPRGSCQ